MQKLLRSRLGMAGFLAASTIVFLANNGNPPNGFTGAPFNSHCNSCHGGNANGYDGTVSISGLPATIEPNTTYPITLTINVNQGNPVKAGFQIVMVDGANNNAGTLNSINSQTGVDVAGGRRYLEHRNGKNFSGGSVSWNFEWVSPASVNGNIVKAYFIGNFCNGNGGTSGDFAKAFNETFSFAGAPPLTAFISDKTDVSCNGGNNGSAIVSANGGNPPYAYLWSNGQTGQTALNLAAGVYTVTVSAGGGATATATVTITQPPVLNASATVSNQITCIEPTAELSASASGGVSPYAFSWSNGDSGQQITVASPGAYAVTVADANGCTRVAQVAVAANTTQPAAAASVNQPITCVVPTVTLSGAGSSQGQQFTYIWTGPGIVSGANTLSPVVNQGGAYTLTVTNAANGCTNAAGVQVVANITPPGAVAIGDTLTCVATSVTLQGSSNDPDATYAWTGPNGFASAQQNPVATLPGTYFLVSTSPANGCTNAATVTVEIDTLSPLALAAPPPALNCNNATVQIDATASSQGNQFGYQWTTANGNIVAGANSLTPVVDAPGIYELLISNSSNGCTAQTQVSVSQTPAPVASAEEVSAIACFGGQGVLTGSGSAGLPPYAYLWSSGDTTATTGPLAAGAYALTISDADGCTATAQIALAQPAALQTALSATPENSAGGSDGTATVAPSGGTAPYSALWNTGDTAFTIVGLAPGNYSATVTDANGCTSSGVVTVNAFGCALAANLEVTPIACAGQNTGVVQIVVIAGDGPFAYAWNTGDTASVLTMLGPGTYVPTITDANNCTLTLSATLIAPSPLSANASATPETANGANDGAASADPVGGTGPYAYLWSNGAQTAQISGLSPGAYTVTVTDANDCEAVQTVTVNAFNCTLNVSFAISHVLCFGQSDGAISALPTGGTPPYSYLWCNGFTTPSLTNMPAGVCGVTITDAASCVTTASPEVLEPMQLVATITSVTPASCVGVADGAIQVEITGGTPPFEFGPNQPLADLATGAYVYTLTDANGCPTTLEFTIPTGDQTPPQIDCPADTEVCVGSSYAFATPEVTDNCALGPDPVQQIAGLPSGSMFPEGETLQTFVATDQNGNTASCSFTVRGLPAPVITLQSIQNDVNNSGQGSICVALTNLPPAQANFFWLRDGQPIVPPINTLCPGNLFEGVYSLIVVNTLNGCSASLAATVENTTGTSDTYRGLAFMLSPNPASDLLQLRLESATAGVVEIFDASGRLALREQLNGDLLFIPVQDLKPGAYVLRLLISEKGIAVRRWLKQ